MEVIWFGFLGSLAAGMFTAVGAVGVWFVREMSEKLEDILLSFAAGIMLAASIFSLLLPALEFGEVQFGSEIAAVLMVILGFVGGAYALDYMNRHLPHEHFLTGHEGPDSQKLGRFWLFVIAITLHNFPEGMAVGTGFAGGDVSNGVSLAAGIAIQNMPEGFAVAVAMIAVGYSRMRGFLVGSLTGLAEPVGGLFGSVAVSIAGPVMPVALAFSAGAMIFIISDEIIPETHRRGFERYATFSLIIGFALMMLLDVTLG